jgi:hypothetical protein
MHLTRACNLSIRQVTAVETFLVASRRRALRATLFVYDVVG